MQRSWCTIQSTVSWKNSDYLRCIHLQKFWPLSNRDPNTVWLPKLNFSYIKHSYLYQIKIGKSLIKIKSPISSVRSILPSLIPKLLSINQSTTLIYIPNLLSCNSQEPLFIQVLLHKVTHAHVCIYTGSLFSTTSYCFSVRFSFKIRFSRKSAKLRCSSRHRLFMSASKLG